MGTFMDMDKMVSRDFEGGLQNLRQIVEASTVKGASKTRRHRIQLLKDFPMHKQIFVNLPCKNLPASKAFFEALGYRFNPQFTSEAGAGLVLGDNLYAMLLTEDFAKGFTAKPLVDAKIATEVLVCLSCDSREQVDQLVAKAAAAGGSVPRRPVDHGFMYSHGFEDLDGHIWELVHMSGMPPQA